MTTIDLDRIKAEIPVESLIAQSLTVVGKGHILTTEEHDSLKIFTTNNSWAWYSRSGRDGKALGGSPIDWYAYVNRCSTGEAIRALAAMLDGGAIPPMPKPREVAPKATAAAWKGERWQGDARRLIEQGIATLWNDGDPVGQVARDELARRSIREDVAVAFDLGAALVWNSKAKRKLPAILIPWQNRQVTAVKYRFVGVGKEDGANRYEQLKGGQTLMFGLQHCVEAEPGQLQNLFLVEGELNGVALFQASYGLYPCDVLSFGPQDNLRNAGVAPLAAKVAERYRRVILWADEPEAALRALKAIPNAVPVRSPEIDSKAFDANDLLMAGLLDEVVFDLLTMNREGF
ncbi:MAG: hypothetical protein R3C14_28720 [Caldilineaceae bacterium]